METNTRDSSCPAWTLADAQKAVDDWIQSLGVRYFSELTNLAQLMEEVGELARIISRTYGEQSFKDSDRDYSLSDEVADVLFVLICIANQTGVDLQSALQRNLEKKTNRDSTRHRDNLKLRTISQQSDHRTGDSLNELDDHAAH